MYTGVSKQNETKPKEKNKLKVEENAFNTLLNALVNAKWCS